MSASHAHQADTPTATGSRLANKISLIGAALEAGAIPASLGRELARKLDQLEAKLEAARRLKLKLWNKLAKAAMAETLSSTG